MNIDKSTIRANLVKHVDCLAGLIGPRTLSNPRSIEASVGYIDGVWRDTGFSVESETFDALGDRATNLVVELPGKNRADELIVLGAHYDTVPTTPGADDNASAVAVMLEVSRILSTCRKSKRTLRCVAFACEEPPYFADSMGSQHHARLARKQGENIVGMLCLEMVGYFRNEIGSQKVPPTIPRFLHRFFPRRANFLAAVGNLDSWKLTWAFRRGFKKRTSFPLFSIVLPEKIHEIRLSDNASFWDQDYQALMLTDTSFLRNPNYHLASDTPDTLDYDAMTEITIGVASAVQRLLR